MRYTIKMAWPKQDRLAARGSSGHYPKPRCNVAGVDKGTRELVLTLHLEDPTSRFCGGKT